MPIYGPAGDVDARPAHLFRCGDLYAVITRPDRLEHSARRLLRRLEAHR